MFGVADIGWMSHKTTNTSGSVSIKSSGIADGNNAGSRIGFRGVEDLGGGLSASFHLEQGISPTSADGYNKRVNSSFHQVDGNTSYTTNNNRQTFLGLSSKDLGTVRVGFQYTNSYDLVAFNGLSASEFQGGNFQNGTTLVAGTSLSTHANGSRANAITYMSNNMGGFTVKAQYGQGSGRQTFESTVPATTSSTTGAGSTGGTNGIAKANNDYWSLMGQYAQGPIYVAAAYSKSDQQNEAGAAPPAAVAAPYTGTGRIGQNAFGAVSSITAPTNTGSRPQTSLHIGASYDFGVAKVSYVGSTNEGAATSSTTKSEVKANQFTVFVPFGAATFFASTGNAKKTTGATVDNKVEGSAFGVRYNLSKRTTAYAFTGSEKDKNVTTASTTAHNYKDSKTVVGVSHSF
ncbi:MAG: porin [Comamonadaceae bacterium]|nr:porin [Comamonadaceae bacterium]